MTTSGATAVQVARSSRRGSREIEHLGSAHDDAELQTLKAAAQQRTAAAQQRTAAEWLSCGVRAHELGAPGWSMQVLARAECDLARICLIAHQWSLLFIFWR